MSTQSDKKPSRALYVPPHLRKNDVTDASRDYESNDLHEGLKSMSDQINGDSYKIQSVETLIRNLSLSNHQSILKKKFPSNENSSASKITPTAVHDVKEVKIDYSQYNHVIELYNFRDDITTDDLQAELIGFESSGFYLKWVDDTHCLAVFSSPTEAKLALTQVSGLSVQARPLKDASLESKHKLAKSPGDWSMPYKRRPPTTPSTANRIIFGHLGLQRSEMKSPEQVAQEKRDKEALAEARASRSKRKKAQKAIWEDDAYDFPRSSS